ncbi:hypothetical protein IH981_00875 [Patescibacteria group bacterium]|nr:hypothetical protein [Patescibacteria group bacterium]
MPEETTSTNQQTPTKVTPAKTPHKINWLHILIGVIIGIVLLGVGFGVYFLTQSKSEPAKESIKVSTPSAKQATPSGQPTTTSTKKDGTEGWKTFTGKYIKVTFKYPPSWKVSEVDGLSTPEGKVNTKVSLNESGKDRGLSITENFLGGFTGLQQTSEKSITIDGILTKKVYLEDEQGGGIQVHIQIERNSKNYFIIGSWADGDLGADEVIDQILATLKFLD